MLAIGVYSPAPYGCCGCGTGGGAAPHAPPTPPPSLELTMATSLSPNPPLAQNSDRSTTPFPS